MGNVIDGFEQLTPQQCFDMAARHVLRNGRPGVDAGGSCVYSGIGCAAAPFLTEEAKSEFNYTWDQMPVPNANRGLIRALQQAHDRAAMDHLNGADFVSAFKRNATEVGAGFGLSLAALDSQP